MFLFPVRSRGRVARAIVGSVATVALVTGLAPSATADEPGGTVVGSTIAAEGGGTASNTWFFKRCDDGGWAIVSAWRHWGDSFSATGLPAGAYRIAFRDGGDDYPGAAAWTFTDGGTDLDSAPDVTVANGEIVDVGSVQLSLGATANVVVDNADELFGDYAVRAYRRDSDGWWEVGAWPLYEMREFAFSGLSAGEHRFAITPMNHGKTPTHSGVWIGGTSFGSATVFDLDSGDVVALPAVALPLSGSASFVDDGPTGRPRGCGPQTTPAPEPTPTPTPKPVAPTPKPNPPVKPPVAKILSFAKAPKVTGKARVGKTLRASKIQVRSSVKAKVKITYRWETKKGKKFVVVKGAKKSSLKLTKKLRGKQVRLRVTVTAPGHETLVRTVKWSKKVA